MLRCGPPPPHVGECQQTHTSGLFATSGLTARQGTGTISTLSTRSEGHNRPWPPPWPPRDPLEPSQLQSNRSSYARCLQPACVGPESATCILRTQLNISECLSVRTLCVYDVLSGAASAQEYPAPTFAADVTNTNKQQPTWQPQACIHDSLPCTVVPSASSRRRALIQAQQQHLGRRHTGHAPQPRKQPL